jgi:hypothetical protein
MGSTSSQPNSQVKLAAASLGLSIVSLVAYTSVITRATNLVFLVATGAALTAGIVSLVLGLVARKQARQAETRSKGRLLVTLSLLIAVGYLIGLGIIALNIIVFQVL